MSAFYPPYQFIPVTGEINGKRIRQGYAEIAQGTAEAHPQVRHDIWTDNALSGRIVCSVYLESPVVIGNQHSDAPPSRQKRIEQYRWRNQIALPANSLRGVIASMAESLSQSALRVLNADEGKTMRIRESDGHQPDGKAPDGKRAVTVPKTVYEYFDHIDQDMKPWQESRNELTVAELLFGVVEVNEKSGDSLATHNLGGRVRFSDAVATEVVRQMPEVTLKLLSAPKTPSPAMYFHVKGHRGEYLSKEQMERYKDSEAIVPNGRKYYLHYPQRQREQRPWESHGNTGQQASKFLCSPLQAEQTFYFHIDFENLSPAELTLLHKAIRPDAQSQHRLGLGKPLGLGSVTIRPEGVFFIDRKARYGLEALAQSKYHRAWIEEEHVAQWKSLYRVEAATPSFPEMPADLQDNEYIDHPTWEIVRTLCNPGNVAGFPVRTPLLPHQENTPEEKTYEWFSQNDLQGNQAMPPIVPGEKLPFLYSDMEAAHRSGRFREVELSAFAPPADDPVNSMPELLRNYFEDARADGSPDEDIAASKALAAYLRDTVTDDAKEAVIDWLVDYWADNEILLGNKVERIYDAAFPGWRKKVAERYEV